MCRAGEMKKRGTTCFFHHRRRTPGRQQRNNGMTQKRKKKRKKPFCGISLILHSYAFTWGGRASPTPAFLRLGCVEVNTQQSCMFPPPSLHGSLCSRLPSALGKDRGCHQLKRHNALEPASACMFPQSGNIHGMGVKGRHVPCRGLGESVPQ